MNELDWGSLGFRYRKTNAIVFSLYRDGQWSEPQLTDDFDFHFNAFAGVFHYGNSCFEGLKAFRGRDGKVRLSGRTRTPDVSGAVPTVFRWPLLPRNCS